MTAGISWDVVMRTKPAKLHRYSQMKLDTMVRMFISTEEWDVEDKAPETIIHILKLFQTLLKIKDQDLQDSEKNTRELACHKSKNEKLKREMDKERKTNEELAERAATADKNIKTLKRRNEHLNHDLGLLHAELDIEKKKEELVRCLRKEKVEIQSQLDLANSQLQQCLEDLQEANNDIFLLKTKAVNEVNMIMKEFQKMNTDVNSLVRERNDAKEKVRELENKIQNMTDEDGSRMAMFTDKAEKWRKELSKKDKEIIDYKWEIKVIREKLLSAKLEMDRSTNIALQWAIQDKDSEIKMLKEHIEQYTSNMEKSVLLIKEIKISINKNREISKSHSLVEEDVRRMEKDEMIQHSIFLERQWSKWEQSMAKLDEVLQDIRDQDKTMKNIFQAREVEQETQPSNASINVPSQKKHGQSEPAIDLNLDVHHLLGINEELRQELKYVEEEANSLLTKLNRAKEKITQLQVQKEESKNLKNLVEEKDKTIHSLEMDIEQQNMVIQAHKKMEEARKEEQRELFVQREETKNLRNLVEEMEKTIRSLEKDIEQQNNTHRTEIEAASNQTTQTIMLKDITINELNHELSAAIDCNSQFQLARHHIQNLQSQLDHKCDALKKRDNQLLEATQNQEDQIKRHQEELRMLHQTWDLQADTSLEHLHQTKRLSELEETLAEQDVSLSSLTKKLNETRVELERQRTSMKTQAEIHAKEISKLEEYHAETKDQRRKMAQMEEEISILQNEMAAQKDILSTSETTLDLVENLKAQLTQKNKLIKSLSKALLELREEMKSAAEHQDNAASQKEERNVKELNEKLKVEEDSTKAARGQCKTLQEELEGLKQRVQRNQYTQRCLQAEKKEGEKEILKVMCRKLEKEKEKMEKRLAHICGEHYNGGTVPELEKIVASLRKLVARLQSENKSLRTFTYIQYDTKLGVVE